MGSQRLLLHTPYIDIHISKYFAYLSEQGSVPMHLDKRGSIVFAILGTDDLVINGSKMWITNGVQSDWICLLANTSEGNPHRNKSLICVPKETKGVSVAKQIDKIGNFCSDTAQLFFEDVVVPKSYIIGEEGKGFTYQMMQFQEERMWAIFSCKLSASVPVYN